MRPLIFFIHVPHTAGSTVNALLKQELPNGIPHCEAIISDDAALTHAAEALDWMSGHVDFTTAKCRLAATTDRAVEFYTCLREPTNQVMSHYNWIIGQNHRHADFCERNPRNFGSIPGAIESSSNNASSTIDNLKRYSALLQNCQSRMVLGTDFQWHDGDIHKRLCQYEGVAPDAASLRSLVSQMVGRDVSIEHRSETVSDYHFDRRGFESKAIQAFLQEWNAFDEMLRYQAVSVCYRRSSKPDATFRFTATP